MLLFFAAAAVAAWLSLRRLFDPWAALAAVLLSCSSWYALYYNDMIFNDVPTLFGVLLAFHGMAVFVQEGRFRQLVVKSCAALLLGWQVYALLLAFIAFGVADALRQRAPWGRPPGGGPWRGGGAVRPACGARRRDAPVRHARAGFNLANEYRAFGGELPLTEVPDFQADTVALRPRAEVAYAAYADRLAWWPYLKHQAASIGGMSLPFLVAGKSISVFGVAHGGRRRRVRGESDRRPAPACTGSAGGLRPVLDDPDAPFRLYPRLSEPLLHRNSAGLVVGGPAASARRVPASPRRGGRGDAGRLPRLDGSHEWCGPWPGAGRSSPGGDRGLRGDPSADVGEGHLRAQVPRSLEIALAAHAINYYLAGSRIGYRDKADRRPLADFILTNRREPGKEDALLTPGARRVFLYDRAAWDGPGT